LSTNNQKVTNNWITQAEAARVRGVSRQAINNLVKKGRLKTMEIASVVFVDKDEIQNFKGLNSGRPKRVKNG
jgi:predicted DNA-binding protein (UPF0251 family)